MFGFMYAMILSAIFCHHNYNHSLLLLKIKDSLMLHEKQGRRLLLECIYVDYIIEAIHFLRIALGGQ